MTERITARFEEFERYDPMTDSERIRFMCITSIGTYHAEVRLHDGRSKRKDRERFRQLAIDCMREGSPPQELSMESH